MQAFDKIKNYCEVVCDQIRWEKAKPVIAKEIENHICDQRDEYIRNGDDEENATNKALLQMGDAEQIGISLDKTHRPQMQCMMLLLSILFMALGATMNFISFFLYGETYISFVPYIIAVGLLFVGYFLDFTILGKYPIHFYSFTVVVTFLMLFTGKPINGRLYAVGPIPFSFVNLAIIFPVIYVLFIYSQKGNGYKGIILSGIAYLPLVLALFMIPSLSGALLYTITSLITLCFAINKGFFRVNKKNGLLLVLIPVLIVVLVLSVFTGLSLYHITQGFIPMIVGDMISQSVFIGSSGVPEGFQNIGDLPLNHSDFMLILLTNSYGLIIPVVLTVFLLIFSIISFKKVCKQKSYLASLITLSIILTFLLQATSYILYNLGYTFSASLSFPFISYGKTSLWINAILIGFMLSVFRTGEVFKDSFVDRTGRTLKGTNEIFKYEDGKLIIKLKNR